MFYSLLMERTTQLINRTEKIKEIIAIWAKKDVDLVLYWHYLTIKNDLNYDYFNEEEC